MEKLVLALGILFISIFVVAIVCLVWIIMPLLRDRKVKKEEPKEPKRKLKKFILAVSKGTTIELVREFPSEANNEEIERAKEKCRGDLGADKEIYCVEAERKDDAFFKLAAQIRNKVFNSEVKKEEI